VPFDSTGKNEKKSLVVFFRTTRLFYNKTL